MAERKAVLVLESETLLAAAVLSLLASRPEFAVTSATFSSLASLDPLDHIEADVIILDKNLLAVNFLAVMQLVDCYPKLRLIVLGLEHNQLHIFDKHIIYVERIEGFLEQL